MQTSNVIDNEDLQILNAIYAAHIMQSNSTFFYSSESWETFLLEHVFDPILDIEVYNTNHIGFIQTLKTRLENKEVPVINSNFSNGGHAINAISLIQDLSMPECYYIGVYDCNYPGEKRFVKIMNSNGKITTRANEYYTNSGRAIHMTPSLEHDLAYFSE